MQVPFAENIPSPYKNQPWLLQSLMMILIGEFMFGHYLLAKAWYEMFQVSDIMREDFFLFLLTVGLISMI